MLVITQLPYIYRFTVISMHFRVFFKIKGTELGYFWGLLKIQIFFGALVIPEIFGG